MILYVKKPECPLRRAGAHPKGEGMNGKMAFSLEEAPCWSTGFSTYQEVDFWW
jgi:hypothetical protein